MQHPREGVPVQTLQKKDTPPWPRVCRSLRAEDTERLNYRGFAGGGGGKGGVGAEGEVPPSE